MVVGDDFGVIVIVQLSQLEEPNLGGTQRPP
jgi:hypothetical protein